MRQSNLFISLRLNKSWHPYDCTGVDTRSNRALAHGARGILITFATALV